MVQILSLLFFFLFVSEQILANFTTQEPSVAVKFLQEETDSAQASSLCFQLNNFPQREKIIFSMYRPLTEKQQILSTFILNDKHITNIGQLLEKSIPLSNIDFFNGERVIFCFQTTDKILVELSMIPCPMIAENTTGDIEISAELTHHNDSIYRIRLTGINDGENFILYSRSADEVIRTRGKFSNTNPMIFLPHVLGKNGGTSKVTFKIRGQEISIDLPWGNTVVSKLANIKLINTNTKSLLLLNQRHALQINNKFIWNPFLGSTSSIADTHFNKKNSYEEAYLKTLLSNEPSTDWNVFTGSLSFN
ncbi:MAG: hypothetical protein JSR93_07485 [Verrucomicrobia bacterium]|nr:hypothetical protein [Verrucomicrobiota bacterium]